MTYLAACMTRVVMHKHGGKDPFIPGFMWNPFAKLVSAGSSERLPHSS